MLHFVGKRRPEKIHPKSPPFFNTKFPGKHEKNIHKIYLESRQSNLLRLLFGKNNSRDKKITSKLKNNLAR